MFVNAIQLLAGVTSNHVLALAWLSSILFALDYLRASTYALRPHWRTVPLSLFNLGVSINFAVKLNYHGISSNEGVGLGVVLLILSVLQTIVLVIFPLPVPLQLFGKYKHVGTMSFNIPVKLPPGTQLHENKREYDMPVQVWFPLSERYATKAGAALWTSGFPAHEAQESRLLLDQLAFDTKLPSFIFSHLALARTNAYYQQDMTGLQELVGEGGSKLPVAIYSHGMYGFRQMGGSACEVGCTLSSIYLYHSNKFLSLFFLLLSSYYCNPHTHTPLPPSQSNVMMV